MKRFVRTILPILTLGTLSAPLISWGWLGPPRSPSLVPTQTTNPVEPGGTTTYTPITIGGGTNGDHVKLTASGLPSGATFNAPPSNCVVVVSNAVSFTGTSVTAGSASGTFTITATEYTSSSCTTGTVTTATATPTLTLTTFSVSVPTQTPNPVEPGGTTTYTPITIDGGTNGDHVKLTASGLPSGATFNAAPPSNCVVVASNARELHGYLGHCGERQWHLHYHGYRVHLVVMHYWDGYHRRR